MREEERPRLEILSPPRVRLGLRRFKRGLLSGTQNFANFRRMQRQGNRARRKVLVSSATSYAKRLPMQLRGRKFPASDWFPIKFFVLANP
jgi:hypothetical protein